VENGILSAVSNVDSNDASRVVICVIVNVGAVFDKERVGDVGLLFDDTK
jgi:hypothetical protein